MLITQPIMSMHLSAHQYDTMKLYKTFGNLG